jgi:hypothetical protein
MGTAWNWHGMFIKHGRTAYIKWEKYNLNAYHIGMAGERHGNGMVYVNPA